MKDFKKLLRTRINVLVLFVKDKASTSNTIKIFQEAAGHVKGEGTMVLMDCSNRWVTKIHEKEERRRRMENSRSIC